MTMADVFLVLIGNTEHNVLMYGCFIDKIYRNKQWGMDDHNINFLQ
jgi:hypothetical protein